MYQIIFPELCKMGRFFFAKKWEKFFCSHTGRLLQGIGRAEPPHCPVPDDSIIPEKQQICFIATARPCGMLKIRFAELPKVRLQNMAVSRPEKPAVRLLPKEFKQMRFSAHRLVGPQILLS